MGTAARWEVVRNITAYLAGQVGERSHFSACLQGVSPRAMQMEGQAIAEHVLDASGRRAGGGGSGGGGGVGDVIPAPAPRLSRRSSSSSLHSGAASPPLPVPVMAHPGGLTGDIPHAFHDRMLLLEGVLLCTQPLRALHYHFMWLSRALAAAPLHHVPAGMMPPYGWAAPPAYPVYHPHHHPAVYHGAPGAPPAHDGPVERAASPPAGVGGNPHAKGMQQA